MIFRNLDENSDWRFGRGKNDYARNSPAVALNVKTRILSWVGDCFFAKTAGIDWANRMSDKNQVELLKQELRRVIIQTQGVTSIETFDIIFLSEQRKFTASYTINTIFSKAYKDSITLES